MSIPRGREKNQILLFHYPMLYRGRDKRRSRFFPTTLYVKYKGREKTRSRFFPTPTCILYRVKKKEILLFPYPYMLNIGMG